MPTQTEIDDFLRKLSKKNASLSCITPTSVWAGRHLGVLDFFDDAGWKANNPAPVDIKVRKLRKKLAPLSKLLIDVMTEAIMFTDFVDDADRAKFAELGAHMAERASKPRFTLD